MESTYISAPSSGAVVQVKSEPSDDLRVVIEVGEEVPRYRSTPPEQHRAGGSQVSVREREESVEVIREQFDDGRLERWRNGQGAGERTTVSRRPSDAQSVGSHSSSSGMGLSSGFEGMSDAEIAQHHFRLAQQHLEAAQRLALAAANRPSSSPVSPLLSLPSSFQSNPHLEISCGDSAVDPSEYQSPVSSTGYDTASEFGRLSVNDAVDASYERQASHAPSSSSNPDYHHSSSSVVSIARSAAASTRSDPTSRTTSTSAASSRFANETGRPTPPPRRATVATGVVVPSARSSGLQPSLYGGNLPPGATDRIRAVQPPLSQAQSQHVEPEQGGMEEDDLISSYGDGESDDGEYLDAESVFSHVTYSTLPPYEFSPGTLPPAVPSIPAQYASPAPSQPSPPSSTLSYSSPYSSQRPSTQPLPSSLPLSTPASSHPYANATPTPPSPVDETFHGFRPRNGAAAQSFPSRAGPRTVVNTPSPYAFSSTPNYQSYSLPSIAAIGPYRQTISQPQTAAALQPHSYVLGPNGHPIPVYAAAPSASTPNLPRTYVVPVQAAQSIVSYSSRPAPLPAATKEYPRAASHPSLPSTINSSASNTSFASPSSTPHSSASNYTVSLSHSLSAGASLARPSSAASSADSTKTTASTATFLRSGMASFRSLAKVKRPTVRFQSPAPDAKSRVGGREKKVGGKGRGGEMRSVFEDSEDDGKGKQLTVEQKMEKQKKAMEFSMAMLT